MGHEQGVDMTEVAAAIAQLNNSEPPSGRVTVPISTFPFSAQIKKEEAEAAVAAKTKKAENPEIGDADKDGWIYAGISPSTGTALFVAPEDTGEVKWKGAVKAAESAEKQGCTNARLPSCDELKQMFNNRARIGGFDGDWYWSSHANPHFEGYMCIKSFRDGEHGIGDKKKSKISVRLVRSGVI